MSFPNKVMTGPFLSEADKADLLFGIQNDVDFVAASFVSNKQNVLDMRKFLDDNGGSQIEIIAKIESVRRGQYRGNLRGLRGHYGGQR